jgi:O-antigen/teichoic acid export membrane protein
MCCGYAASLLVARRLGVEAFGQFAVIQAAVGIGATAFALGLPQYGARKLAREKGNQQGWIWHVLLLKLATVCLLGPILLLLLTKETSLLGVANNAAGAIAVWLILQTTNPEWIAQGLQKPELVAKTRFLQQTAYLAVVYAVVHSADNLIETIYSRSLSLILPGFLLAVGTNLTSTKINKCDTKTVGAHLQGGLPFVWLSILQITLSSSPALMTGIISGTHQAGVFAATFNLTSVFTSVVTMVNGALFPILANLNAKRDPRYQVICAWYLRSATLAAIVTVAVLPLAPLILKLTIGPQYSESLNVFRILTIASAIHIINAALAQPMLASGQENRVLYQMQFTVILYVGTALIIIPILGAAGAAISYGCSIAAGTLYLGIKRVAQ